ncbi:MAG: glycosyltransferase family 2 protein [Planctomycetia bacterium]|nr:glycosyltransferase family 2 protein [Planctomycetia bacterium]
MLVSVIVTTKNEERNIGHCMKSIKFQSYENREIIVIDNFSTDKTKEIALKYINKVYDKGPERSAQRNFGMINIAKGKYVMFVDADMILSPRLVESCVKEMEKDCQSLTSNFQTQPLKPETQNLQLITQHQVPKI